MENIIKKVDDLRKALSELEQIVKTWEEYINQKREWKKKAFDAKRNEGKKYMIINAKIDSRTCKVCRAANGQRRMIKNGIPLSWYPPLHPNCRCKLDFV